MRKYIVFILLFFSLLPGYGQNPLIGKTLRYRTIGLIHEQDTLRLFHLDSSRVIWRVRNVRMKFNAGGTYEGTDNAGNIKTGNWALIGANRIIVGPDTNQIVRLTTTELTTTADIRFKSGNRWIEGKSFAVLTLDNTCKSLTSGSWTDPAVWTCGREPTPDDTVVINAGHLITIPHPEAKAFRMEFKGGTLHFGSSQSKLELKSN